MKSRKSVSCALLILTLLLAGSSVRAGKVRPISDNGKPLTFQVSHVSVTQEQQLSEQMEFFLSNLMQGGQVNTNYKYTPFPLSPSESFVIVTFSISNVNHQLQLSIWGYQVDRRQGVRS